MNNFHSLLIIVVVSLVTIAIRFFPFILFQKKTPTIVSRLGKKLPYAIMAMLVVYCLKDSDITGFTTMLPTLIGVISVIVIHCLKKNILISIVLGTTIYIIALHIL